MPVISAFSRALIIGAQAGPLLSLLLFTACNPVAVSEVEKGKALAKVYCSSCHLPVAPELLDKKTWTKHVLPAMAPRLGIGVWRGDQYYPGSKDNTGPIGFEEWLSIVAYFDAQAPDSLAGAEASRPLKDGLSWFSIMRPVWKDTTEVATTTMVSINPDNGIVYSSGGERQALLQAWDGSLNPSAVMNSESPVVDMTWVNADTALLTSIGTVIAYDEPRGDVKKIAIGSPGVNRTQMIARSLPRPVQTLAEDFNKDGQTDYVVCGFGHNSGGLYLLQKNIKGGFERDTLWNAPGAIHAICQDFNKDDWPDLMVLFAYGDESIRLFLNDRKGGFESKDLLRFPPVYGATSFQVVDWNNDHHPDILFTAGDNADFSTVLKPYHGVYVYLNKGDFTFDLVYFYPLNGATKAIAADFDGDGDLDIAAIAFFADLLRRPEEKFAYFEQSGNLHFEPYTILQLAQEGRWICMDAGDYDRDGDIDIVLGNYSRGFLNQDHVKQDWNTRQPILSLQNNKESNLRSPDP